MRVLVIIPAFNEARSIGLVVNDLPRDLIEEVVVVNNASTDETEENAKKAGATVVREDRQGYGWACLKGMEYANTKEPDVIVFLDGDYSDHPEEIVDLLAPIKRNEVDFVIGSRMTGKKEPGAMLPQALLGNRLACWLMWLFWRGHFTDLGPFRAIRYKHLMALGMEDKTYGWTIEMQIKVLKAGYRYTEVPVSYRKRVGVSKITGTISGTLKASYKILWTIAKYAFSAPKLDALEVRKKVPTAR